MVKLKKVGKRLELGGKMSVGGAGAGRCKSQVEEYKRLGRECGTTEVFSVGLSPSCALQ